MRDDENDVHRTTVQIVAIVDGVARHVRKLTLDLPADYVLAEVQEIFTGHLVRAKNRRQNLRDRGKDPAYGAGQGGEGE